MKYETNPIYPAVASGEAGTNPIYPAVASGEAGTNPIYPVVAGFRKAKFSLTNGRITATFS